MTKYDFTPADVDNFIQSLPPELTELCEIHDSADEILNRLRGIMRLLCAGLTKRSRDALEVFTVCRQNLSRLIGEVKSLIGPGRLRSYLHYQMLLHPYRRMPLASYMLILSCSSSKLRLNEMFRVASERFMEWQERVNDSDTILLDPELLPAELFEASLVRATEPSEAVDEACVVCGSPFEFQPCEAAGSTPVSPCSAMRTPCNHHFCYECLRLWRLEASKGTYRCPMCRSCLVCGKPNCTFHIVSEEHARPYPLQEFLEVHFEGVKSRPPPYYGFDPIALRRIRETTRHLRVEYGYYHLRIEDPTISEKEKEHCEDRMDKAMREIVKTIIHVLDQTGAPTARPSSLRRSDGCNRAE